MIAEAYKKLIGSVCVVTSEFNGNLAGCTVSWFSRVSHNPALIMVSLGFTRKTTDIVLKSGKFCLNVCSDKQLELARFFGLKSGKNIDKFENVAYFFGKTGVPVLENTAAYFECEMYSVHKAGDHFMCVGEIKEYFCSKEKPLLYVPEDYK
jgi:flavin reductase (DIM6/NTAB) family NADH-FMN oxidoreductase RutF